MHEENKILNKETFLKKVNDLQPFYHAIIILDLDNSRKLFGEVLNSKVLRKILNLLNSHFYNSIAAQVGRDSFAALITKEDINVFDLVDKKNQLQLELSGYLDTSITFCMGVSILNQNCKFIDDIYSIARDGLFIAKQKGENMTEFPAEETMKLKSVYLRKRQIEQMGYLSRISGKSESVIIRKAIDDYLDKNSF